jgi:hypothetical protein
LYCIGASVLFWGVLYFTLIAPPMPQLAPQTFVAIALTVMTALIIPLFWSILVPTTPAGQLLQKTQWGTIGFWVILGGALYMTWYAKLWIGLWWASQQIKGDDCPHASNSECGTGRHCRFADPRTGRAAFGL